MGGHLCRRTFSSRHLADSPASGGETLRPTACESALAVNLGTNTRKTEGGFGEPERVRDHRNSDV